MTDTQHDTLVRTGYFVTADGLSLFRRAWIPSDRLRASVILVHGYAEHSGRYDELARYLATSGIATYSYDQRGAGNSEGRRGRIDRFGALTDDLEVFIATVPTDGPLFFMGHSLGGVVLLDWSLRSCSPRPDGLILSSPALRITSGFPAVAENLLTRIARFAPALPTVPIDRSALSHDPEVVRQSSQDSLNFHGRVSLRTATEMLRAGPRVLERAGDVTLPFLVFTGTEDAITHASGSYELFGRSSSLHKTLAVYLGLFHETFREPQKHAVLDGIRLWLEERLAELVDETCR